MSLCSPHLFQEGKGINLGSGIKSSVAKKCQYYQLTTRNNGRPDDLWSYLYQTVLVETLGDQGEAST